MNHSALLSIGLLCLASMAWAQPLLERSGSSTGTSVGLVERCHPQVPLPQREAAARALLSQGLPDTLAQLERLSGFLSGQDMPSAQALRRALLEKVESLSPALPAERKSQQKLETSVLAQLSMHGWRSGDGRWNRRYIHAAEQALAALPGDPEATAELVRAREFEGALLWTKSLTQARTAYQSAADLHARAMAANILPNTTEQQARMIELTLKVNDADWDLGNTKTAAAVYEKAHAQLRGLERTPAWWDAALVLVAAYQVRGTQAVKQGDKAGAVEAFALALTVADNIENAPPNSRGGLRQLTKRCGGLAVETALSASLWQTANALCQTQDLPAHKSLFRLPLPQDGETLSADRLKHLTIDLLKLRSACGLPMAQQYERSRRPADRPAARTTAAQTEEMKSLFLLGLAYIGSDQATLASINFERAEAITQQLQGVPLATLRNWRAALLANLAATEFVSGNKAAALERQRDAAALLLSLERDNQLTPASRQLRRLLQNGADPKQVFQANGDEPFWIDLLLEDLRK